MARILRIARVCSLFSDITLALKFPFEETTEVKLCMCDICSVKY